MLEVRGLRSTRMPTRGCRSISNVRSRLTESVDEVMTDIESRMAEIFREGLPSSLMVVSLRMVEGAISRMGRPEEFGPRTTPSEEEHRGASDTSSPRPLRRIRKGRVLAGVCGGLAKYLELDPSLVRVLMLIFVVCFGLSVWFYIILWIVIPEQDDKEDSSESFKHFNKGCQR